MTTNANAHPKVQEWRRILALFVMGLLLFVTLTGLSI